VQFARRAPSRRRAGPVGHHDRVPNQHGDHQHHAQDDDCRHADRCLRSDAVAGLRDQVTAAHDVQQPPVYLVRAGRQECHDRLVFHLNGAGPVDYSVRYVDVVTEDGSGKPMPVAGGAALQVISNAPALGHDGHGYVGKMLAEPGAGFYTPTQLAGWGTLREVRYAASLLLRLGRRGRPPVAQVEAPGSAMSCKDVIR
jgi:hypothetical protein